MKKILQGVGLTLLVALIVVGGWIQLTATAAATWTGHSKLWASHEPTVGISMRRNQYDAIRNGMENRVPGARMILLRILLVAPAVLMSLLLGRLFHDPDELAVARRVWRAAITGHW